MTRLQEHYQKTVKPALTKQFGYKNPHQVPRVVKVVVNMGVGEAITDAKMVDAAWEKSSRGDPISKNPRFKRFTDSGIRVQDIH